MEQQDTQDTFDRSYAEQGLSDQKAAALAAQGYSNADAEVKAKSLGQIFKENILTLFNLLNFALGFLVLSVGAFQNAMFLLVVFFNLSIGIVNQIRAKRAVEKLSVLSKVRVKVVRSGQIRQVDFSEIVLGDVLVLETGSQIPADCRVLQGDCEADENMLTGESETVHKMPGDLLYSGSYLVSGRCRAVAEHVGKESYAARLANENREIKAVNSQILNSLNAIIKVLTVFIVIMGSLMFVKEYFLLGEGIKDSIFSTTAAVIGMIPEGLILLTNVALALGVMKLARQNTLVQELYAIETLARVDMLCVDKTGTITDGTLEVAPGACEGIGADWQRTLTHMLYAVEDDNATANALKNWLPPLEDAPYCLQKVNFSSARKWSGAAWKHGSAVLGAPEALHLELEAEAAQRILEKQQQGMRVLLLAESAQGFEMQPDGSPALPHGLDLRAVLCLEERVRPEAPEIFAYLRQNGIGIKIISGDSARTVYAIAKKAGATTEGGYADVFEMDEAQLEAIIEDTMVFGRVSPAQKKQIVRHLREKGYTVAMTGDGVNDVPALKEADCSITLRTGSDAARTISQIVLMDGNLYSIYHTILEGNRVINNIQRSTSLFLIKTIFSCALTALFMLLPLSYPFYPVQLTLISSLGIGIPSFLLAFQRSYGHIDGDFFGPVLRRAIPGALSIVSFVLMLTAAGTLLQWPEQQTALLCTIAAGICVFYTMFRVMRPWCLWKVLVCTALLGAFTGAILLFPSLFYFAPCTWQIAVYAGIMGALVWPLCKAFEGVTQKILDWMRSRNTK